MKNSVVSLFSVLLAVIISATLFTACLQDTVKDLAPGAPATLGFTDSARPDAEKYIPAPEGQRIKGRYIVQLTNEFLLPGALQDTASKAGREVMQKAAESRQAEGEQKIRSLIGEFGIEKEKAPQIFTEAVSAFVADLTDEEVKHLLTDDRVLSVTEDQVIVFDLPKIEATQDVPEAQFLPCGIARHNGPSSGPSSKWIWIVDSGISQHADLNVVTNTTYAKAFIGTGGPFNDCVGHGTHVAGIAAARNNTFGVVGMSAGAPVVPVRVLDCNNYGTYTSILGGINHVALYDESGDVCNLSLGGYYGSGCSTNSVYKTAVTNLAASGTWVVMAAGNNGNNAALYEPACINGTRILTVANMDCYNYWNFGSNYGIGPVDWIAVGTQVYSTYPGNQYATMTGTSMSAPHVAGIVHARQGNPVQCGWVYRYNTGYKVACR